MKAKNKAKEYLLQVRKLDAIIRNKKMEIAQWKDIATGTTSNSEGERVQSSSDPHKMENAVVTYADIEKEMVEELVSFVKKKNEIIATIQQLNTTEYDVIHKMYIGVLEEDQHGFSYVKYLTLDEIAELYEKSYSWATSIHGRALKNVQMIIDKKDK